MLKTHVHFYETSSVLVWSSTKPGTECLNIKKRTIPPNTQMAGSKCVCTNTLNHYLPAFPMPKREDDFCASKHDHILGVKFVQDACSEALRVLIHKPVVLESSLASLVLETDLVQEAA